MKVEVHLRDARTSMVFESRADLTRVLAASPDHKGPSVRAHFHETQGPNQPLTYDAPVRSLNRGQIGYVIEVPD